MISDAKSEITGLVLAGGLGRRMGGADKGLQSLNGKPMAARVLERLEPQVGAILVNANRNVEAYAALGKPVVADRLGGFVGPLAGMHAGLTACTTAFLATVPCDSPFLPQDLVERLRGGIAASDAKAAVARAAGRVQPVFALMRRDVLDSLTAFLEGGGRSAHAWFASLPLAVVDFADAQAFANFNTADELARFDLPG